MSFTINMKNSNLFLQKKQSRRLNHTGFANIS